MTVPRHLPIPRPRAQRLAAAVVALAVVLPLTGCASPESTPGRPSPTKHVQPSGPASPSTGLVALLERVEVREVKWSQGYTRAAFGPEWTDDYTGPFGHNGCDTRQDVLLEQMHHIEMRWGSDCRIYEATLTDPYTGEHLTWRDDGYWIEIDHIYPLARAWDAGAQAWPTSKRVRFANDVRRELLAVSHQANQAKGAQTLAEWLPAPAYRCGYARRYLKVAIAWQLPISPADADVVRRLAGRCN